jgi:ribosomal protein S3AE
MNSAYIQYFLQRVKVRKIDVETGPEEQQQSMMNSEVQPPTKLTP